MKQVFNDIVTMDIEGDARNKDINQAMFPTGCHFDPGTIPWCVTFTLWSSLNNSYTTDTIVCKLSDKPRKYPNPFYIRGRLYTDTGIYHEKSSKVDKYGLMGTPSKYCNGVVRYMSVYDNYQDFLVSVVSGIIRYTHNYEYIYSKPYKDNAGIRYNYDKICIKNALRNHAGRNKYYAYLDERVNPIWDKMRTWLPKDWDPTSPQVHDNNEIYMNNGIRHNIEDTEQLCYRIKEQTNVCRKIYGINNKIQAIEGDF